MGYTDRREVKQFQYTAWPDHGVPEHPGPFLTFLRRITNVNPVDAGPVITHCRFVFYPTNQIIFCFNFYLFTTHIIFLILINDRLTTKSQL